jgi:hypothetical protein
VRYAHSARHFPIQTAKARGMMRVKYTAMPTLAATATIVNAPGRAGRARMIGAHPYVVATRAVPPHQFRRSRQISANSAENVAVLALDGGEQERLKLLAGLLDFAGKDVRVAVIGDRPRPAVGAGGARVTHEDAP